LNKKKKGFLCLALCLILTVSFGMQGLRVNATNMSSITSDSIRDKQDQIKQAEKEREQMKSNLSNLEQIKKDLETQKTNLKNYVTQLDQNLSQIEQNIADLKNKITAKEEEIAKTQAELDAALEREENQKDAMIRRIRIMYEKGDSYILDMMLKAESFSDFLNRADFMDLIMAYDRQQWKDFMENRKYIELCKEELEEEKAILDEAKAGVEQEQANMEALIDQKNRDITASVLRLYLPDLNIEKYPVLVKQDSDQKIFNSEREILYQVLFDMKKDVNELKKLVHDIMGGKMPIEMPEEPAAYPHPIHTVHPVPSIQEAEAVEEEESLSLEEVEKEMIRKALEKHNGRRKNAAADLKISERTLYRKIKEYNLE